jgi:hypothetical protein
MDMENGYQDARVRAYKRMKKIYPIKLNTYNMSIAATTALGEYRRAIGKLVSEAVYVYKYEKGIVPVFAVSLQSILEPYVRIILEDLIQNSTEFVDLRIYGLNGYVWEYELLAQMCTAAAQQFNPIHESESENESIRESENQDGSFYESDTE